MAAKGRYEKLASQGREQFLQRARHNAILTIPALMPLEGHDQKQHLIEPYNGLGSAVVVHLSSRITMNLLPANRPHMRLDVPAELINQTEDGKIPEETSAALALSEKSVQSEVERVGWREETLASVQQLLVAGNVCEQILPSGELRLFRLDQYVTNRNFAGKVIEAIIEEKLTANTVPDDVVLSDVDKNDPDAEVCVYTTIMWDNSRKAYHIWQEVEDKQTGYEGWFTEKDLPYLFLTWARTPGEDYGRSKVGEHVADFRSLEGLVKAGLEIAAMGARNFIAIRPGAVGVNVKRRISKAISGDVVMVDQESVGLMSFDNLQGHQVVDIQAQKIIDRISRAFLLQSAGQRDAERVTATEIERDIQELEAALGGNFSILNHRMMKRRTELLINLMVANQKLPEALNELTEPTILTGLEALSRERDVSRVRQLIEIAQPFGPEVMAETYNVSSLLSKAAIGVGFADVINTEAEKDAIRKRRQEAELAKAVAGPAAGGVAREGGAE